MLPKISSTPNKPSGASTSASPISKRQPKTASPISKRRPKTKSLISDGFEHYPLKSQAGSLNGNGAKADTALPLSFDSLKTEQLYNLFVASAFKTAIKEKFQDVVPNKWFEEISITTVLDITFDGIKKFSKQISNKELCFFFYLQILIKKFHQYHHLVPIEKAIDCIEHVMRCGQKLDNIEECEDITELMAQLVVVTWNDLTSNLKYEQKTKKFFDQLDEDGGNLSRPYCVEWIIGTVKNIEGGCELSKITLLGKVSLIKTILYRIHRVTTQPELLRNFQASLPSASSHSVS